MIKFFREVTQPILWEVHIYPLVKTHSILWEKSTILGEVVYYPLGKMHYFLRKKHIYPMVSGTLSSGKWHIILWEKKLIPSGNWTRGNWNIALFLVCFDHFYFLQQISNCLQRTSY